MFNLSADTLLNDSDIQLPNLAIVDTFLDEKFADEEAVAFDMAMVINSTKTSAKFYDNLAHYLISEVITAQDSAGDFDFFSPWDLVHNPRLDIGSYRLSLGDNAALKGEATVFYVDGPRFTLSIPKIFLAKNMLEPPQVTPPPIDMMAEWIKHVSHVPSLLPAEILMLLCIIFALLFKVVCIIYGARKKETARTRLVLEIGNESDRIVLPAMDLPYLAKY